MDTINRNNINGKVPEGAQYAMQNPAKQFIQKFYRITERGNAQFYGEQGGWHPSGFSKEQLLAKDTVLKIIDDENISD